MGVTPSHKLGLVTMAFSERVVSLGGDYIIGLFLFPKILSFQTKLLMTFWISSLHMSILEIVFSIQDSQKSCIEVTCYHCTFLEMLIQRKQVVRSEAAIIPIPKEVLGLYNGQRLVKFGVQARKCQKHQKLGVTLWISHPQGFHGMTQVQLQSYKTMVRDRNPNISTLHHLE